MEAHSSIIRGLINDLLRALSASLVHVDDLIMKLERSSDGFLDAMLTNEQLSRSIELFLDLRSECNYFREQLFDKKTNLLKKSAIFATNQFKHGLNELLTTVMGSCDLMLTDNNKERIIDNVTIIRNSIINHIVMRKKIHIFPWQYGLRQKKR